MTGFSFKNFINHMQAIIRQPELHMKEIPILIGLIILLVFIILTFIAIFFMKPSTKKAEPIEREKLVPKLKKLYIAIGVFSILTIVSIGFVLSYTARPGFCLSCHEMKEAYNKSPDVVHKGVGCLSCHQGPGIANMFIERLELAEMVITKSGVAGNVISPQVSNEACLTCHADIVKAVVVHGTIKVKHKEPLEAGYRCTECHFSKGLFHVEKRQLDNFGMSRCVDCHNQTKAKADCKVCHTNQGGYVQILNRNDYPKVNLSNKIACNKCHLPSSCLSCHQIQVPHPESWQAGGHALRGFVEKKVCLECHDGPFCEKCHTSDSPHGDNWVKEHGQAAKVSLAWCISCHNTANFCLNCHTDVTSYQIKEGIDKPLISEDTQTPHL